MRVIAGKYRRRRLKTLPGCETRPTPDRLREALFGVIAPEIKGKAFGDLYAGSGAVGIEALSRGAKLSIFVESNPMAVRVIQESLHTLGVKGEGRVIKATVDEALSSLAANVYFLAPPYTLVDEYPKILDRLGRTQANLVVSQHLVHQELANNYGLLQRSRVIRQGKNCLSFYRPQQL